MNSIIIYQNASDNCVGILYPMVDSGLPIEAIARKDVPAEAPYKIVPADFFAEQQNLPREEWSADFSSPDGYGDLRYGAGTDYEVVEYFEQGGLIHLKARNIHTGEIIELQA
jgi:hypothetical protein